MTREAVEWGTDEALAAVEANEPDLAVACIECHCAALHHSEEVAEFYARFYGYKPSEEEVDRMMRHELPAGIRDPQPEAPVRPLPSAGSALRPASTCPCSRAV